MYTPRFALLIALGAAAFAWSCSERPTPTQAPVEVQAAAPTPAPVASVVPDGPAHGPTGAIFTTTPNGGKVNENVKYPDKLWVYLDGGPRNDNPYAAALDDGWYIFQITDPSGKYLLSMDPAKCRVVEVQGGVIQRVVPPSEMGLGLTNTYTVGKDTYPCQITDAPDGAYGVSGRHDINTDTDPGGGIVVQMMPYGTTPNPGDEYKAWVTTWGAYKAKVGTALATALNTVPTAVKGRDAHPCPDFCADPDPGFGPPRDLQKTDNFKVKAVPPFLRIVKYNDLNGNGALDAGEPPIPGWMVTLNEPVYDMSTVTNAYFTGTDGTVTIPLASNTTVTVCEQQKTGWQMTFATVNGTDVTGTAYAKTVDGLTFKCIPNIATGTGPTTIQMAFGNFELVKVQACKLEDKTGDGQTADDTPIGGWTVKLTKNGVVQDTKATGTDGCYTWTDLGPVPGGYYDVSEDVPAGWTPTSATSHSFASPPSSGSAYSFTFTNFKNVEVKACKLEDKTGDGQSADDTPIPGWSVNLTKSGTIIDTQPTGTDGCYTWTNLGPVVSGYYDVAETVPAGWTATSATSHNFTSPPTSGAAYAFTFTNFKNVEVTACKKLDSDASLITTDDETLKAGWPVALTKSGTVVDEQTTGANGCYTWTDLGPLPAGGYYDVHEGALSGYTPVTPASYSFESVPRSGAHYSYTFVNTPAQGCTPGFWQGGVGITLWNTKPDPDWAARIGGVNPFQESDLFNNYNLGAPGTFSAASELNGMSMLDIVGTGGTEIVAQKTARDVIAAYLNTSAGIAYPYTQTQIVSMWNAANLAADRATALMNLHLLLDAANNLHNAPLCR